MTLSNNEMKNSRESILVLFPFLIFIGKLLRWTLMKTVLVETGIGQYIIESIQDGTADKFYLFYKWINIFNLTTYEGYEIYLSVLLNIILLVIFLLINRELSIIEFCFYSLSVIVLNLFDFTLAKDPIQFLFFVAIFVILVNFRSEFWIYFASVTVLIACGLCFRTYYLLMAAYVVILFFFFRLCKKMKLKKWKVVVISIIGFTLFYCAILYLARFADSDSYDELIRVRTRSSSATTNIEALFYSDNLFIFACNYTLTIIRMLIPVELLRFGPKYYMYVLYQLIITGFVMASVIKMNQLRKKQYIALIITMAFILCSAAFEPDFGSWIRHEAVMFPIFIVMTDSIKMNNIMKENNGIAEET